jgi:aspartate/methionine/tyrosine aminotransferase/SAM-dependent methyltransferase
MVGGRPSVTEIQLSDGLEPIRGMFVAHAIYALIDTQLLSQLSDIPTKISTLVDELQLNPRRTLALFQFLAVEGYIHLSPDGMVSLSSSGVLLHAMAPWYHLLVGGYSETLGQLTACLKRDGGYATRNGAQVAQGSCGISQHDALPMVSALIEPVRDQIDRIVDIGCGDGSFLIDLIARTPGVNGLGIETSEATVEAARREVSARGLDARIEIRLDRGQALDTGEFSKATVVYVVAFVLQEILEQSGRAILIATLRRLSDSVETAYFAIIEVDNRIDDSLLMHHPLAKSYYNPYYLLHHLTEQRLESRDYWIDLFSEAELELLDENRPNREYDSLGLKMGFLLKASRERERSLRCAPPPIATIDRMIEDAGRPADLINLSQGAPDYGPSGVLVDHLTARLADRSHAAYTERSGRESLRDAVARDFTRTVGLNVSADAVLVTAGANEAFCCASAALIDEQDEVLVATPHYFNHSMWLDLVGASTKYIDTAPTWNLTMEELEKSITSRTRALVVTCPSNPTGAQMTTEQLGEIQAVCQARDVWLIVDLTYSAFGHHLDLGQIDVDWLRNTAFLLSFSKQFAMPGYRVGALIGSADLVRNAAKVHDCLSICAPSLGQDAVEFALEWCVGWREDKALIIASRRAYFTQLMATDPGDFILVSIGGFFAWVRHPFEETSFEVSRRLLIESSIAVLPGSLFYAGGQRYLRMSVANADEETLATVVERLAQLSGRPS